MLDELLVILGAEMILLASLLAMNLWRRRSDVLSRRYLRPQRDPGPAAVQPVETPRPLALHEQTSLRQAEKRSRRPSIIRLTRLSGRLAARLTRTIFRRRPPGGPFVGSSIDAISPVVRQPRTVEVPWQTPAQV